MALSSLNKSVVKPYKPLGPDPLPSKLPIKQQNAQRNTYHCKQYLYEDLLYDFYSEDQFTNANLNRENTFCLNDFLVRKNSFCDEDDMNVDNHIYLSSDNYNKICKVLEARIQRDKNNNSNNVRICVNSMFALFTLQFYFFLNRFTFKL